MSRRSNREALFKLIYAYLHKKEVYNFRKDSFDFVKQERIDIKALRLDYNDVLKNIDEILETLESNLTRYKLNKIYKVDLAILVVSIYEFSCSKKCSSAVSINEAVELAKKFSTDKSYIFVNGVLATVAKNLKV